MDKLIEISVRGSTYFYLSEVDEIQFSQLKQFAGQFYISNPVFEYKSDEEITKYFATAVKHKFDIELRKMPVMLVLVVK